MEKLVLVGRAIKTPKIENFRLKVCSLGPRGDPHKSHLGNPQRDLEATRTDLEATHDETSRQPARTSRQPAWTLRQAAMIGNELYHTQGLTSTRYPTRPDFLFATRARPELFLEIPEFRVFPSKLFPSRKKLQIFKQKSSNSVVF